MEFLELLVDEHKPIRRAVEVLRVMAKTEAWTDRHDVNALLMFLHYFADACHQAKEESLLFPVLISSCAPDACLEIDVLLKEHREERSFIEKVQLALFTDTRSEFNRRAKELVELLSKHITQEENVLFPLAERILTREKASEIAMRMHEADAEFGHTQRKLLLDLLEQLEARYTSKAA